jgi:hypothetical protein
MSITFQSQITRAVVIASWHALIAIGAVMISLFNFWNTFWLLYLLFWELIVMGSLFLPGVGKFEITSEGVKCLAFLRQPRSLRWQEVERVMWRNDRACFKSSDKSIPIQWTMIRQDEATRAKAFLKELLSAYFDLSEPAAPAWSFERNLRSILLWTIRVSGVVIVGAGIVLVPTYAIARYYPEYWYLARFLVFVPLIAFLIEALRLAKRDKRINPTWRLRRVEERPS